MGAGEAKGEKRGRVKERGKGRKEGELKKGVGKERKNTPSIDSRVVRSPLSRH